MMPVVRPRIYVMHAAFDDERHGALINLLERAPSSYVVRDYDRKGAWPVAKRCWEQGLHDEATHICVLNDDALPCLHFEDVLANAISAVPNDILSLYTNHNKAKQVHAAGHHWYSTVDGLVGVGCVLPRYIAQRFLEWEATCLNGKPITDDGKINLFAMCEGLRIFTTVPSLVDHQLPGSSLVGNEQDEHRRPVVPPESDMRSIEWTPFHVPFMGRQYRGNHWMLMTHLTEDAKKRYDAIAKAYAIERTT